MDEMKCSGRINVNARQNIRLVTKKTLCAGESSSARYRPSSPASPSAWNNVWPSAFLVEPVLNLRLSRDADVGRTKC